MIVKNLQLDENFTDSDRDAKKYNGLLHSLKNLTSKMHQFSKDNLDVDSLISSILPDLAYALNAHGAFCATYKQLSNPTEITLTANYPSKKNVSNPIVLSEYLYFKFLTNEAFIIDPLDDHPDKCIDGFEFINITSAVFAFLKTNNFHRVICVYNRKNPELPFVNADKITLDSLLAFIGSGVRLAEDQINKFGSLQKIATEINTKHDLNSTLKYIVEEAYNFFNITDIGLYLWNKEKTHLIYSSGIGNHENSLKMHQISKNSFEIVVNEHNHKNVIYIDHSHHREFINAKVMLKKSDFKSGLLKIIQADNGDILGILLLASEFQRFFSEQDKRFLTTFSNYIAIAIHKIRIRMQDEINLLDGIQNIVKESNLKKGLYALAKHTVTYLHGTFCCITLYEEKEDSITITALYPVKREKNEINLSPQQDKKIYLHKNKEYVFLRDLSTTKSYSINSTNQNVDHHHLRLVSQLVGLTGQLSQCLVIPLLISNEYLGSIIFGEMRNRYDSIFSHEKIQQAEQLANQAVFLIKKIQHQEQREHNLQTLHDTANKILLSQSIKSNDIYDTIAKCASNAINADCAVVYPFLSDYEVFDHKNIGSYNLKNKMNLSKKLRYNKNSLMSIAIDSNDKTTVKIIVDDVFFGLDKSHEIQINITENQIFNKESIVSFICIGMFLEHKPIGILFVNFRRYHTFTDDEIEMIELIANQAAFAINQSKDAISAGKNKSIIEMIEILNAQLNANQSIDYIYNSILDSINNTFNASISALYLLEPNREQLSLQSLKSKTEINLNKEFSRDSHPEIFKILDSQKAKILLNAEDKFAISIFGRVPNIKTILVIPFEMSERKIIGTLLIGSNQSAAYTLSDVSMLEKIGEFVCIAIQSNTNFLKNQELIRLQSGLLSAGTEITYLEKKKENLINIVDTVRRALLCDLVTLHLFDPDIDEFEVPAIYSGTLKNPIAFFKDNEVKKSSLVWYILKSGEPYYTHNTKSDKLMTSRKKTKINPFENFVEREGISSSAGIPLIIDNKKMGVLFINYYSTHYFSANEEDAINTFSSQIAGILLNIQLQKVIDKKNQLLYAFNDAEKIIVDNINSSRNQILQNILKYFYEGLQSINLSPSIVAIYLVSQSKPELQLSNIYPHTFDQSEKTTNKISLNRNLASSTIQGIAGKCYYYKEIQFLNNTKKSIKYAMINKDSLSVIAIPIKMKDEVIGVLNIECKINKVLKKYEEDTFHNMARTISTAIENSVLYSRVADYENFHLRSQFTSDLIHSLNNQFGTLPIRINRIKKSLPSKCNDEIINKELDKIASDVSRILDDAKKVQLLPEIEYISGIKQIIEGILRGEISKFGEKIKYSIKSDANLPPIKAIRANFENSITFLVSNAVEAVNNQNGIIDIKLLLHKYSNTSKKIEIQISDNGTAIDPTLYEEIFKVGFSTKGEFHGYGLWRARNLIEAMGGSLTLEKSTMKGMTKTFLIFIPVE